MKKAALKVIGFIFCTLVLFAACSKSDTYADKLKNERKTIKRFINEHDIEVLYEYPKSGVFEKNQYFVDSSSGVYINVIDSGNGKRAQLRSNVYFRFWDAISFTSTPDTTSFDDIQSGLQPLNFIYGVEESYTSSSSYIASGFMSAGVTLPLKYVGENAIVSLIIPFNSGSTYQRSGYYPVYFTKLKYTMID